MEKTAKIYFNVQCAIEVEFETADDLEKAIEDGKAEIHHLLPQGGFSVFWAYHENIVSPANAIKDVVKT
jgi:hypothetical protein